MTIRCLAVLAVAAAVAVVQADPGSKDLGLHAATANPRLQQPPPLYLNPEADVEARARDLVSRMTIEEKVPQLMDQAPAIPRLGVPAYGWWNESLHGVARAGVATVFPQAIGLAATFDVPLIGEMAEVIGNEARAKHHQFARDGKRGRYQGLTFWSPNINIFRDPRWGRGQETYGEDPFLTGRIGVAFVKGLQGDDPRYYRVIATAKHYAVHSGPEARPPHVRRQAERARPVGHLPAGVPGSRAGGEGRLRHERLQPHQRRVGHGQRAVSQRHSSDAVGVHRLRGVRLRSGRRHLQAPQARGDGRGGARRWPVASGCDLECGSAFRALKGALAQGLVKEADIDAALVRLFTARMKLGMFDPPERVRWAQIPYSVNDAPEHDRLARRVAQSSIVLLKNSGLLPLRKDIGSIAVVGPTADDLASLLGNYNGTPARPVTVLAGIRNAVSPKTRVVYERGVDLVEGRQDPRAASVIDAAYLRPAPDSPQRGLTGRYYRGRSFEGEPVFTRVDQKLQFRWDRGAPTDELVARGELPPDRALPDDGYSVRWTGVLVPPVTGDYELVVTANDGARVIVGGRTVVDAWTDAPVARASSGTERFEAGREYPVVIEYYEAERDAEVRLGWRLPSAESPFDAAVSAARASDAVVFVGGLTAEVEGEEMRVSYPGFAGGDRTDIALPAVQQKLLEALHATGKPVILVLTTGSAVGLKWAKENLPGILVAWYPGQQGGNAVADVLFGDTNPAGRLPVTFYESVGQLPPFADYDMEGRTYRYFRGEPVYPFGFGLSYTTFELLGTSALAAGRLRATASKPMCGEERRLTRRRRSGAALCAGGASARPAAIRNLRGFERVPLAAGEGTRVRFTLVPERDFATYDEARRAYAAEPGDYEVEFGASSADIRAQRARDGAGDIPRTSRR